MSEQESNQIYGNEVPADKSATTVCSSSKALSFSPASAIHRFLNQEVVVSIFNEEKVSGILASVDRSRHNGIGCLILQNKDYEWIVIRNWKTIATKPLA